MIQLKDIIKISMGTLEVEIKNYYKSSNEVFLASAGCTVVYFSTFVIASSIFKIPIDSISGLMGGVPSALSLSSGFLQLIERRDKARYLERQYRTFELLSEMTELNPANEADQNQLVTYILDLSLRTIKAPYEFTSKQTEGTHS